MSYILEESWENFKMEQAQPGAHPVQITQKVFAKIYKVNLYFYSNFKGHCSHIFTASDKKSDLHLHVNEKYLRFQVVMPK